MLHNTQTKSVSRNLSTLIAQRGFLIAVEYFMPFFEGCMQFRLIVHLFIHYEGHVNYIGPKDL